MLCKFEKVIFPRDASASNSGFMIAIYKPCGTLRDAAGHILDSFKAVGYCLPTSNKVKYRLEGKWSILAPERCLHTHHLAHNIWELRELLESSSVPKSLIPEVILASLLLSHELSNRPEAEYQRRGGVPAPVAGT